MPGAERDRDLERFVTFLDAMVAIAITLLVLPLVDLVPELRDQRSVGDLLRDNLYELGAFVLSFSVIARLWYAQHRSMRHVVAMDARVYTALMLWALSIVFLPFPSALVASQGDQPLVKGLYIGTFTLSMAFLSLLAWVVRRDPSLTDGEGRPDLGAALRNTTLLVLALVLALVVPGASYWSLLLLVLDGALARLIDRVLRR